MPAPVARRKPALVQTGPHMPKPTAPNTAPNTDTAAKSDAKTGDRIAKVLARAGVASRRSAEVMIAEGRVRVNGAVIDSPALNVTARDKIAVDGKPIGKPEPVRVWVYNKPLGLVTPSATRKAALRCSKPCPRTCRE